MSLFLFFGRDAEVAGGEILKVGADVREPVGQQREHPQGHGEIPCVVQQGHYLWDCLIGSPLEVFPEYIDEGMVCDELQIALIVFTEKRICLGGVVPRQEGDMLIRQVILPVPAVQKRFYSVLP